MTKTEALKIARQAKPTKATATEKQVRRVCEDNNVTVPFVDGSDLRSINALAAAIVRYNA